MHNKQKKVKVKKNYEEEEEERNLKNNSSKKLLVSLSHLVIIVLLHILIQLVKLGVFSALEVANTKANVRVAVQVV